MSENNNREQTILSRQQQRRSKRNALKHQSLPNSRNMHFQEIMDDLTIRFIMNCPEEEFESFDRLFFQIEEAHWFYEDFYREHNKSLPALSFRQFVDKVFEHCPVLSPFREAIEKYIQSFYEYKTTVPVYGAIILNQAQDKVLLVKGWNSKSWTFPRGKINQDEPELICAAREVKEEIGFDISPYLKTNDFIHMNFNEQSIKLFIVTGIPETTAFAPQTRKEIRGIEWHSIDGVMQARSPSNPKKSASKYWTITAFMPKLKRWLLKNAAASQKHQHHQQPAKNASHKRKLSPKVEATSPSDESSPSISRSQKRGRKGRKSPTQPEILQRERSNSGSEQAESKKSAQRILSFNEPAVEALHQHKPPAILKRNESTMSNNSGAINAPFPVLPASPPQYHFTYPHPFNPYAFVQQYPIHTVYNYPPTAQMMGQNC